MKTKTDEKLDLAIKQSGGRKEEIENIKKERDILKCFLIKLHQESLRVGDEELAERTESVLDKTGKWRK